jgi:hypothetical protein
MERVLSQLGNNADALLLTEKELGDSTYSTKPSISNKAQGSKASSVVCDSTKFTDTRNTYSIGTRM